MKQPVKGAPVPKAKTAVHRKPAPVAKAVKTARHAAAVKAAKTRAANAKKAKLHSVRKLALGQGVACCSAEALAASLRLAGAAVSDDDVLALYWRTAGDADAGASILATLEAASRFGIGGYHPRWLPVPHALAAGNFVVADAKLGFGPADEARHGLILGVDVPGPHAVLATDGGWWSWGQLHDPWTDDISEAWEVTW